MKKKYTEKKLSSEGAKALIKALAEANDNVVKQPKKTTKKKQSDERAKARFFVAQMR